MSDLLRAHIKDFGFKHAEIARRASKLNQATTYRVVEGETSNPSLNSITGIIEAISLTDADAGVLYRKMGIDNAKPRLFALPNTEQDYESVKRVAKNHLDSGRIRDAAHSVMAMFDLAHTQDQFCETYEQAGIVYMGLGRWEEAQMNFEAADAHLQCDIDDPQTPQALIDRKHALMTNIGNLMIKRKNTDWAAIFGKSVVMHSRSNPTNKGWGHLIIGEVALERKNPKAACLEFKRALEIFQLEEQRVKESNGIEQEQRCRLLHQAIGNCRWAEIHLLKSRHLLGERVAGEILKQKEAEWWGIDPEASTMAGLFHAEGLTSSNRRQMMLQDLRSRAKRYGLGEIAKRISALICLCMVVGITNGHLANACDLLAVLEKSQTAFKPDAYPPKKRIKPTGKYGPKPLQRGNTGG